MKFRTIIPHRTTSLHVASSTSTTSVGVTTPQLTPSLLPVRPTTSTNPRPTLKNNLRLGAASLLSRSPLLLKPLNEFEDSYYHYQRELHHAISKPIKSSFFFRPGSHAAKAFELSLKSSQSSIQLDPLPTDTKIINPDRSQQNFHDIQRNPTRFIHLLFKCLDPSNQKSYWQLPTEKIAAPSFDLTQASLRAIHSNAGPDMDIWSVGRVPATVYKPPLDSDTRFDKVWVMPQRILRGQPKLEVVKEKDGDHFQVQDFGWFCSEEIKDRVHLDIWNALEPIIK